MGGLQRFDLIIILYYSYTDLSPPDMQAQPADVMNSKRRNASFGRVCTDDFKSTLYFIIIELIPHLISHVVNVFRCIN